ncbi:MAG: hypothetical protein A4E40_01004 [Methanoregulaceae archaeon PtaU1.Bin059]|nr:MAG: hypothetical protein A4E40_01004 [Methanoregulaceae archaeon PtaU1.Bin059]
MTGIDIFFLHADALLFPGRGVIQLAGMAWAMPDSCQKMPPEKAPWNMEFPGRSTTPQSA